MLVPETTVSSVFHIHLVLIVLKTACKPVLSLVCLNGIKQPSPIAHFRSHRVLYFALAKSTLSTRHPTGDISNCTVFLWSRESDNDIWDFSPVAGSAWRGAYSSLFISCSYTCGLWIVPAPGFFEGTPSAHYPKYRVSRTLLIWG